MRQNLLAISALIRERAPGFTPTVGIVLGSGLGPLADHVENPIEISYSELPEFPISTAKGHAGKLILGKISGISVVCLKGRVHLYEGYAPQKIKLLIRLLKHLGCHTVLLTNAAGSLREEVGPGEISLITDHISLQFPNPLIGQNDEEYGERFIAMNGAYDSKLGEKMHETAKKLKIKLHEGVYLAAMGPMFETPAEIRAFRIWGADLVGMSTVPEVVVARHCGLRVLAMSAVVNLAAGMNEIIPSHKETLHYGRIVSKNMCKLVAEFLKENQKEMS